MPMNDEDADKLKAELEQTKKQLMELLEKTKQDANAAAEAEKARSKSKPDTLKLDPDVVKEIGELKVKVVELEKKLGSAGGSSSPMRLNFFKGD